jgi:catechol 2,3-dioxygenase-like lactoylglutathione lyase family enzyme
MLVRTLDHVNIRTERLAETVEFYAERLGLACRPAPGRPDTSQGAWFYDGEDRPVIHVGTFNVRYPTDEVMPEGLVPGRGSGAVHHIALECDGYEEAVDRFKAAGLTLAFGNIPSIQLRQVFLTDPNGITVELNFRGQA